VGGDLVRQALGGVAVLGVLLGAGLSHAEPSSGTLRGTVVVSTADGPRTPPPGAGIVVYVTGWDSPPRALVSRMDQRNKTFVPRVLPIVKGESVAFTNGDEILHNVFSRSRAKEFDLGKNRKSESHTLRFDKTGMVDIFCDIHESMSASILVLPNAAYATLDAKGGFEIPGIPPGTHTAFAFQRGTAPMNLKFSLTAGETAELRFELPETRDDEKHLDKHGRPYKDRGGYQRGDDEKH
jgi:plastocyanin